MVLERPFVLLLLISILIISCEKNSWGEQELLYTFPRQILLQLKFIITQFSKKRF